jgi:hypothetical protein
MPGRAKPGEVTADLRPLRGTVSRDWGDARHPGDQPELFSPICVVLQPSFCRLLLSGPRGLEIFKIVLGMPNVLLYMVPVKC